MRIAHMKVDDGGPGGMRLERRCGDLRRRHRNVRVFADGIGRPGDGTSDENLGCQHNEPQSIPPDWPDRRIRPWYGSKHKEFPLQLFVRAPVLECSAYNR